MKRPPLNSPCPNPNCDKIVVKVTPRFADETPQEVVPYYYMAKKTLIGRIYHHEDGTLCDESLCIIRASTTARGGYEPHWQRLGDSTIDPRS